MFFSQFNRHFTRCVECGRKVRSKYAFQIICDDCFDDVLDRLD